MNRYIFEQDNLWYSRFRVSVALCVLIFLSSCQLSKTDGQLLIHELAKRRFHNLALASNSERRPVIVIPGILGSRLISPVTGRPIWGEFGLRHLLSPFDGNLVRNISIPIQHHSSSPVPQADLVVDGVLKKLPFYFIPFVPFGVSVYQEMVSQIGNLGYCNIQLEVCNSQLPSNDNSAVNPPLLQFSYDWRLSSVHNAALLHAFIEQQSITIAKQRGLSTADAGTIDFDIVCHSMGCLVARYFLRYGSQSLPQDGMSLPKLDWAGSKRVKNLVMVSPPNAGSLGAIQVLRRGFYVLGFGYSASTLATMPSLYELLPRKDHLPIINRDGKPLDPLNILTWEDNNWGPFSPAEDKFLEALLPGVSTRKERLRIFKEHMKKNLISATLFQRSIDLQAKPPYGLKLWLFAGKSRATPSSLRMEKSGDWTLLRDLLGDGVILSESTLMSGSYGTQKSTPISNSSIGWSGVTFLFSDHLGLASNPEFVVNLDFILGGSNHVPWCPVKP